MKSSTSTRRYIFQFSLIQTESQEASLKKLIEKLGGEVDESPVSLNVFFFIPHYLVTIVDQ